MPVDYDLGTARGRIEIDSSQLGRTSAAFQTFGRTTLVAGLAAAAAFGYVVKSAADFEKQMDAVGAVSNASKAEMKALSDQALDLSTTSVYSANEIGGAMEALAKAGIPVEDMLGGATEATIALAAAAGDELPGGVERAAEVIANAMKTFNAGADEMDHFADVLVGAAASSTLSVEDLATSMRYAGPIAAALGLSIDDLSTVLAVLGDRGIKGSTAGTSLRGVLLSLTPSSAKARDAMKELGLITEDGANKFYDLHGNLKPIPEVMQLLQDATKGLSEQEKVAAFNAIFQRRAMNSAMIMAELGAAGFEEYASAIAGIDADDVAAKKLDNLNGDIQILRNSVDALVIRAGAPLQDMLRGWVQGLTDVVQWLNTIDEGLLTTIVQVIGAAGAMLILIGSLSLIAGWIIRAYRNFILLKEGVALLAHSFKLLSVSFLTNPVVLIIAAIIALIAILYLAYRRSDEFREAFDKAFDKIQPTIEAVVGWVQNFVSYLDELWSAFQDGGIEGEGFADVLDKMGVSAEVVVGVLVWVRDALIWLKNAAITAFDYFADTILPTLLAVGWAIIQGIGAGIDWLINTGIPAIISFGEEVAEVAGAVGRFFQRIGGWIAEHMGPPLLALVDLISSVADQVIGHWNRMAELIGVAIDFISGYIDLMWPLWNLMATPAKIAISTIVGLFDNFIAAVKRAWSYFGDNFIELILIVWDYLVKGWQAVFQIITGIFTIFSAIISGDWSKLWEGLKTLLGGVWDAIWIIVVTALRLVRLAIEGALDIIVFMWKTSWDIMSELVGVVWQLILDVVTAALSWIWGIITSVIGAVIGFWFDAWWQVMSILAGAWLAIQGAILAGLGWIASQLGALAGNVVTWIGDLAGTLYQKGVDLLTGFLNGIITKAWELATWALGLPDAIVAAIGDLATTLYSAGTDLIQGLIDGISDKIGDLTDKLSSVTDLIPDWKGPPEKDAKLLTDNGILIMQGFIRGIESQWPAVQKLLTGYTNSLSMDVVANPGAMRGVGAGNTVLNFDFSGGTFGPGAEEAVKGAISDPEVLDAILRSAKAGRR